MGKEEVRETQRLTTWMLGISVMKSPSQKASEPGGWHRSGIALIMAALPESRQSECGDDGESRKAWAAGVVDEMARRLRERGWLAPEALDGDRTFEEDDAWGELDFADRKGEGWRLSPGAFAIADATLEGASGEEALRQAMRDLEAVAGEMGLLDVEFAREIRGFWGLEGKPGFTATPPTLYSEEEMLEELGAKLDARALRGELDRAAGREKKAPGAGRARL